VSSNRRNIERKPYQDPRIPGVTAKVSAKYHPRATVRESKVSGDTSSRFFAKPKFEQFPRVKPRLNPRIAQNPIESVQVQVISPLLNLSRESITFGETNRPTGRRIKREREKIRREEGKRVRMRARSRSI